jgi:hypothetical protein
MRRWTATLMLLLAATPTLAYERGPVCREPNVVDEMTREIRADNYYADVDQRLITEQPTLDPRVIRCDVCVLYAPYNTVRFGDYPIARCVARGFDVLTLSNGFVVSRAP